jgi:hypothetical protein
VESLRAAGMADDDVVALLGRGIARSLGATATASRGDFHFETEVAETAPECDLSYRRIFVHTDFVDGVTVVQAGSTPDEEGFNVRFHALEAELDAVSRDLHTSSNCVAELRRELWGVTRELEAKITEIERRLDAKGKDKDSKDTKEKEKEKEGKDTKEKETKESKDKEGKDTKEGKDGKEHKDGKEGKDGKDHVDKVRGVEKLQGTDRVPLQGGQLQADPFLPSATVADGTVGPGDDQADGEIQPGEPVRAFIRLADRPAVGEAALRDPQPATEPRH